MARSRWTISRIMLWIVVIAVILGILRTDPIALYLAFILALPFGFAYAVVRLCRWAVIPGPCPARKRVPDLSCPVLTSQDRQAAVKPDLLTQEAIAHDPRL